MCYAESLDESVEEKVIEFFAVVRETCATEFCTAVIKEIANEFSGRKVLA